MENKEELEKFKGLGADEKDKKEEFTKEDLLKTFDLNGDGVISQEEIDIVRKNIEKIVKDPNNSFGKSFLDAYNRLPKEEQNNISEEDIEKLKNENIVRNESIKKLQEEREKMLKEEEEDLFKKFNDSLGGEISENAKHFQEIKRGILIGLLFGLPGVMFVALKDTFDKNKVTTKFNEAIEEYVESGDKDTFKSAIDIAQKYFGNIVDIKKMKDSILTDGTIQKLDQNKEELSKTIISCKEDIKNKEKEIDNLLDEAVFKEEEETQEEIEEEEDPEPVEGMKFM